MAIIDVSNITNFADFLVWPTLHFYYFYLVIFLTLIFLLSWRLYKFEESRTGTGDLISALGTSTVAFSVLGIFGTLIKSTQDIPMIQSDILLYLFAITIPIVLIWIFRGR